MLLPGVQGVAAVAEVPLGCDGVAEATVELERPVPLLLVDVLGLVEVELLGVVEVVLLGVVVVEVDVPVLVLLDGVHGATVLVVPVWFCMRAAGYRSSAAGHARRPLRNCRTSGLEPGCDVCRVPAELGCVDPGCVDPGCVVAEPGWLVVVPGC